MSDVRRTEGPAGNDAARIRFLIDLGRALHEYGLPAHRLEAALGQAAAKLGIRTEILSTPTSLTLSFGEPGCQHTALSRVEPADLQLDKVVALDEVVQAVYRAELGVEEAVARLDAIRTAPVRHGPVLTTLAFGVVSGTAARFLGGGWPEMGLALVLGLLSGLLAVLAGRSVTVARVFEFTVALVATVLAHAVARHVHPLAANLVVVAGLVILLPGLTLTLAMNELGTGHLVSGTARLTGALMTFFKIGLGVGLGGQLAALLPGVAVDVAANTPHPWTLWASLLVTPAGLVVLFRARWRELAWITAGALVTFWSARLAVGHFDVGLGSVVGALTAGLAGNLYARLRGKPAVVVLVPSLILLVPGTIGYRSFSMLLARDIMSGVDSAFTVMLVGVSLVSGLLLANVLLPPRHEL